MQWFLEKGTTRIKTENYRNSVKIDLKKIGFTSLAFSFHPIYWFCVQKSEPWRTPVLTVVIILFLKQL